MAEHKESRAKSAMGGKKSSRKRTGRKVREMHIKRGKSGGYIVRHDLEPQSKQDMMNSMMDDQSNTEDHSVPNLAAMQDHLASHMPEESEAEPDQGGAAAPGEM